MKKPERNDFQGGAVSKVLKFLLLALFCYSVIAVVALQRKSTLAIVIGGVSMIALVIISLRESFRYWSAMKKWSFEVRKEPIQAPETTRGK